MEKFLVGKKNEKLSWEQFAERRKQKKFWTIYISNKQKKKETSETWKESLNKCFFLWPMSSFSVKIFLRKLLLEQLPWWFFQEYEFQYIPVDQCCLFNFSDYYQFRFCTFASSSAVGQWSVQNPVFKPLTYE